MALYDNCSVTPDGGQLLVERLFDTFSQILEHTPFSMRRFVLLVDYSVTIQGQKFNELEHVQEADCRDVDKTCRSCVVPMNSNGLFRIHGS